MSNSSMKLLFSGWISITKFLGKVICWQYSRIYFPSEITLTFFLTQLIFTYYIHSSCTQYWNIQVKFIILSLFGNFLLTFYVVVLNYFCSAHFHVIYSMFTLSYEIDYFEKSDLFLFFSIYLYNTMTKFYN